MKYSDKLKDPRWQKKRLEILSRDEFTCQHCGSKENTLHIHHTYYGKGLEPWEAEDRWLITLCEFCHYDESENFNHQCDDLMLMFKQAGLTSHSLDPIISDFINKYNP